MSIVDVINVLGPFAVLVLLVMIIAGGLCITVFMFWFIAQMIRDW